MHQLLVTHTLLITSSVITHYTTTTSEGQLEWPAVHHLQAATTTSEGQLGWCRTVPHLLYAYKLGRQFQDDRCLQPTPQLHMYVKLQNAPAHLTWGGVFCASIHPRACLLQTAY